MSEGVNVVVLNFCKDFEDTVSEHFELTLTDENDAAIDVSDTGLVSSVVLEVFDAATPDSGASTVLNPTGSVTSATDVEFDDNWDQLKRGKHPYFIRVNFVGGKRWTPVKGTITVE